MLSAMLSLMVRPFASDLLHFDGATFSEPAGEPSMVPATSVSWRVFSNPFTVLIGGIAAVILELAEPRVRSGVWTFSSFRDDPGERMRRTGAAAMVTVFGARSELEALTARVNAIHRQIEGVTDAGEPYRADDPELLLWVQATASFAFMTAYDAYACRLSAEERNAFYAEARATAPLYGVVNAPSTEANVQALFEALKPRLEGSPALDEFLQIMRTAPILPPLLRPLQPLIVRAAVDLIPDDLREWLALGSEAGLSGGRRRLVALLARAAGKVHVPESPWAQALARLGLPANSLDS